MPQHHRDTSAQVRIRCDENTFIKECYDWWRDGCLNCVACSAIDSYETGASSHQTFVDRMKLLFDVTGGRHGDGVMLPGQQLSFGLSSTFPSRRSTRR